MGDYRKVERIGQGNFATVWKAVDRKTRRTVAIKEIPRKMIRPELLEQEVKIMKTSHHPNIVSLLDMFQSEGNVHLVMEFCEGGDLQNYLNNHGRRLATEVTRRIMQQLASALQVLRKQHLIHRDLKPHNLLLTSKREEDMTVKLADFGLARTLMDDAENMARTICGTYLYMAPEVFGQCKYNSKADLWSVGVMLYEMCTGVLPFRGRNPAEIQDAKTKEEVKFLAEDCWDPSCRDLCQKLLRKNPVERISFEEFFNHEFLQDVAKVDAQQCQNAGDPPKVFPSKSPDFRRPAEVIKPPSRLGSNKYNVDVMKDYVIVPTTSEVCKNRATPPIPPRINKAVNTSLPKKPRKEVVTTSLPEKEVDEKLRNLKGCAALLQEVARSKFQDRKFEQALSVQLMALLSIKRALSISNLSQEILKEFESAVDSAKAMSSCVAGGNQKMPDAAEIIYEAAISVGRAGGCDEILENFTRASVEYAKALTLFFFLIMEESPVRLHPQKVGRIRRLFDAVNDIDHQEQAAELKSEEKKIETHPHVSANEQVELCKWMLEEKRKVKPSSSEEKARIDLEKAILKDYIRGKIPSL